MWQSILNISGGAPSGVCIAILGTGNNVSETRLGGKGSRGQEDVALSTDHLFALGTGFGLSDVLLVMGEFLKINIKSSQGEM